MERCSKSGSGRAWLGSAALRNRVATRRHRLLLLLVAVLAVLADTTGEALATTLSSVDVALPVSETRVGVAAAPAPLLVGSRAPANPVFVGQIGCGYDGLESGSCVATKTGAGLGDDSTKALDDIDSGAARPNVRKPEPFSNDGRGGTARLLGSDSLGIRSPTRSTR